MENCLDGLRDKICILYLDDVIAFEDHVVHVQRLRENGVKLKQKIQVIRERSGVSGTYCVRKRLLNGPAGVEAIHHLKSSLPKNIDDAGV